MPTEQSPEPVYQSFYIDGQWVEPSGTETLDVINPATEEPIAAIALGTSADVERAVAAARAAFDSWSQTSVEERVDCLNRIAAGLQARARDIGAVVSAEMGMPVRQAVAIQVGLPALHFSNYAKVAADYAFATDAGSTRIVREPVGVCAFITPWNFPLNQIAGKVAPALAAGCTMVLKPSEVAPLSACLLAEVIDEAGVPPGVFNLVNGTGPDVGAPLAVHPGVDMVSFTGSTHAGISVAKAAADTVKRVTQELGGKSPNVILDDADLEAAVTGGVRQCFFNSGQACNSPTRMLVPASLHERAVGIACAAAEATRVGDPTLKQSMLGPVVSATQFERVQDLIRAGIEEGATLVAGGPGRPDGLEHGFYVQPTVFANVRNEMRIAREEIFGPVLSIIPYEDEDDALRIANDTEYGLSSYVSSGDPARARRVAMRLRAGQVHINGAEFDAGAPFGGYKMSGNGREFGEWGLDEFLETKALLGFSD